MRLRACLGIMLLGLGACAQIPAVLRIEVDGSILEYKKKPPAETAAEAETPPAEAPSPTAGDAPKR